MDSTVLSRSAAILLMAAGCAFAADAVTIGDVAPKESFVVAGVNDWAKAQEAFKTSGLGALIEEPEVKAFIAKVWEDEEIAADWKTFKDFLTEIGRDEEDLKYPTGPVGLALFTTGEAGAAGLEAVGEQPGIFFMADFGQNAESMKDIVQKGLEHSEKKGEVELKEETYEGTTIWVVKNIIKPDAEGEGEDEPDDFDLGMVPGLDVPTPSAPTESFVAWSGNHWLYSSTMPQIEKAIDSLGGKKSESVGDLPVFEETLSQHPDDVHGYVTFFMTDTLREAFRSGMSEGAGATAGIDVDGGNLAKAMGFSSFKSLSLGLRLGADNNVSDMSIGVLMPSKGGLFALLDGPGGPFDPPAFVSPDTSSVGKLTVQFSKIFDVAKEVFRGMPPEMGEQALAGMDSIEGMVGPALKTLGPDIYLVSSIERPLNPKSSKTVGMIKTGDALALNNAIVGFTGMMGMEARDFQGNPIYEEPNTKSAIGIGFGYLFVGNGAEVENAMRRASSPEGARLATEDRFRRAIAPLGEDAGFYGWSDFAQSIDWTLWSAKNSDKITLSQLEELGIEITDEMREEYAKEVDEISKALPSADVLKRHLGDTIFVMRSTPDGFRGTLTQRKPLSE